MRRNKQIPDGTRRKKKLDRNTAIRRTAAFCFIRMSMVLYELVVSFLLPMEQLEKFNYRKLRSTYFTSVPRFFFISGPRWARSAPLLCVRHDKVSEKIYEAIAKKKNVHRPAPIRATREAIRFLRPIPKPSERSPPLTPTRDPRALNGIDLKNCSLRF